jgi:hypothetical protein
MAPFLTGYPPVQDKQLRQLLSFLTNSQLSFEKSSYPDWVIPQKPWPAFDRSGR